MVGGRGKAEAAAQDSQALERAAARVRLLATSYEPPSFDHVPDADSALFLCAVDHKSGYEREHIVAGEGPLRGSALMWAVGLEAARREPGLLTAGRLGAVSREEIAAWFLVGGETVADPGRRAELWRDLAQGLQRDYRGDVAALLAVCKGRLAGPRGLLARLASYAAFSDPLGKKSYLFAKIAERRGWFQVADPDAWEVSADSVLMRVCLRSGLVEPGPLDKVRAATRERCAEVAGAAGVAIPLLDDMLWELGREDPDLLGNVADDLREPPRDPRSAWY